MLHLLAAKKNCWLKDLIDIPAEELAIQYEILFPAKKEAPQWT